MISTGNDIVALNAVNITRTKQPRFYSKILSASEISLYKSAPQISEIPLEIFVWLLWSVKESAYKYLQRINPELVFSPVKFIASKITPPVNKTLKLFNIPQIEGIGFDNLTIYKGTIAYADNNLYFASVIHPEFIHTVVNSTESFKKTHWGIRYINNTNIENQSAEVRSFLLDKLKILLAEDDIRIEKTQGGCPIILKQDTVINLPVSLAHHENWIAYSFQL